jgi:hypothetical protein
MARYIDITIEQINKAHIKETAFILEKIIREPNKYPFMKSLRTRYVCTNPYKMELITYKMMKNSHLQL